MNRANLLPRWLVGLLLSLCIVGVVSAARADEFTSEQAPAPAAAVPAAEAPTARAWSDGSAIPVPAGRVDFGLFQPLRWGVSEDVELAAQPLLEPIFPNVEARVRWLHRGAFSIATWHRLTYPTRLLQTVSREGTLGLLPANTDVPIALGLDTSFLVTVASAGDRTRGTLELGVSLIPRLSAGDPVVLDFPFLYSRFAALSTSGTTYAGLAMTTLLSDNFTLAADARATLIPVVSRGWMLEHGASITWTPSAHFGLSLGYRVAHGRYPVGVRTHLLPTLDVMFGF